MRHPLLTGATAGLCRPSTAASAEPDFLHENLLVHIEKHLRNSQSSDSDSLVLQSGMLASSSSSLKKRRGRTADVGMGDGVSGAGDAGPERKGKEATPVWEPQPQHGVPDSVTVTLPVPLSGVRVGRRDDVEPLLGYEEEPYEEKERIPYCSVGLALFLLGVGSWMLGTVILSLFGCIEELGDGYGSMSLLGMMTFIPGCYYTVIFILAFVGREGYSYSDIPDF